jgi:ankyrin repeat protein
MVQMCALLQNDGWTPLHLASQEGHVKMAEILIQMGADVCSLTKNGWTPLHSASQEGHVKIAELLIQRVQMCTCL